VAEEPTPRSGRSAPASPTPEGAGGPPGDGAPARPRGTPGPALAAAAGARERSRAARAARAAARTTLTVALVAIIALAAIVVWLQTEAGRGRVKSIALGQIDELLAEDATVEAARLEGNFLTGARLVGLVIRQDGEPTVTIDTVLVEYNLRTLIRRTFSAGELYIAGPTVYVRELADGSFNVQHLLRPDVDDPDATRRPFTVEMDLVGVHRGRVEVHFASPENDSVLVATNVLLRASGFHSSRDSLVARLDTFRTRVSAPHDAALVDLAASGSLTRQLLDLSSLGIASRAGTRVRGQARYRLDAADLLHAVAIDVAADPLALEDVRAFSGLPIYGDPRLRLVARPDGPAMAVSLNATLGGGQAVLDAAIDRDGDGPLNYRIEGQIRGFDPAPLLRDPSLAANLNGEVFVDFSGTQLRTLDGPFRVRLADSRIGDRAFRLFDAEGAFRAGRLDFDIDADIPGARLTADGAARPFDPVPTYEATGRASELDVQALLNGAGPDLRLRGDFAFRGSGSSLEAAVAEGMLTLDELRIGREEGEDIALSRADVTARLRGGTVSFTVDSEIAGGGGRFEAAGTARPFDESITFRVDDGRVSGLDVAALTGNPAHSSDLSGRVAIDGAGVGTDAMSLDFATELTGSRFGELDLRALNAAGSVRAGNLTFDANADLGEGGRVQARGAARPFDPTITYNASGRAENFNLARVLGDPRHESDITGDFRIESIGTDLRTSAITGTLDLARSSYGARTVEGTDIDFTLRSGRLVYDGTVRTTDGELVVSGDGRPFDATPSFAFRGSRFRNLDVGALLGRPDLRIVLSGEFDGEIRGTDPRTMMANGTAVLGPSIVSDASIARGQASFTLESGLLVADGVIALAEGTGGAAPFDLDRDGKPDDAALAPEGAPGGTAEFSLSGRLFDATPTYAVRASLHRLDVPALLGRAGERPTRLTGKLQLTGAGVVLDSMVASGSFTSGSSAVYGLRMDTLDTAFSLDRGALLLDAFVLRSDLADATGSGRVNLVGEPAAGATDLSLQAVLKDPETLEALVGRPITLGAGDVAVNLTGEAGGPVRLEASAEAERLGYGEFSLTGLDTRASATWDPVTGEITARTDVAFDLLSTDRFLVERGDVALIYDVDSLTAEGSVIIDGNRDLVFFVRASLDQPERGFDLAAARIVLGEDRWTLQRATRIVYDADSNPETPGPYRVRNLLLVSDRGDRLVADGLIDPGGTQAFLLTAEHVRIDRFTDLIGYDGLGGSLSTTLSLSGPADAPTIDGTLVIDSLTSRGETVGALETDVAYAASRLNLDARLTHISGRRLTAEGFLPLHLSLAGATPEPDVDPAEGAVRFVVRADSFPIAWVRPFLNPRKFSAIGGALTIDDSVTVTGTQQAPRLAGRARVSNGRIGIVSTGRVYQTITATATFEGNRIALAGTVADPEAGRVVADGTITLRELRLGELDLTLRPDGFLAIQTPTYRGLVLDAGAQPLRLTGTLQRPVLRGGVSVRSGDIYVTDDLIAPDLEQIELTQEDLLVLQERFGRRITQRDTATSRFMRALDYDLDVSIRRNVWLRASSGLPFDIEFAGNVRAVKGTYRDTTNLYGAIDVTRGSVETLNRRFEVQRGSIILNGPASQAFADVVATMSIRTDIAVDQPAVEISLYFQGRLSENPEIRLTSNPPLESADIVSLIATGRLAEDLVGAGALEGAATGLALGQLSGLVEGVAANTFGLDVVQVEIDRDGQLVIRLGEYLTERAFVAIAQPLSATSRDRQAISTPTVTLDYALMRWLQLQLEAAQRGSGAGVVYRISY